jgi:hypothetical protein
MLGDSFELAPLGVTSPSTFEGLGVRHPIAA